MLAGNPRIGSYIAGKTPDERYRAFIPPPLPPQPPVRLETFTLLLDRANQAIGRLDGITSILPDRRLFISMYGRKEAVLSSQIEGTQSSLSDLLLFEGERVTEALDDVQEVSSYVAAMNHGLERLKGGFPLSLRLIREIHAILLTQGRGRHHAPGEFRTSQNWIGGTRPGNAVYVPPPPESLMSCLDAFEKFLHADTPVLPVLVKAALVHVQFESIHPFLDGNGRLGRLLITFLVCAADVLREPTLYLSLYLKRNRERYYDHLQQVRLAGDWESWIEFFLSGVEETANQAVQTAREIVELMNADRAKIENLGRPTASALRLHHYLQRRPLTSVASAANALKLSTPTVIASVEHLQRLDILKEVTGMRKKRLYAYQRYVDILSQGTEPLPLTSSPR